MNTPVNIACCLRWRTMRGTWFFGQLEEALGWECKFHLNYWRPKHKREFSYQAEYSTPTIVADLAAAYNVPEAALKAMCELEPTMRKVLLCLYLRRFARLDYCLLVGDDLVLLEARPKILELAKAKVQFLVPEVGASPVDSSREPKLDAFLREHGWPVNYQPNFAGSGFNSDFMGIDLSVFDRFDTQALLDLCQLHPRWLDQSVLVGLVFASAKPSVITNHGVCFQRYNRFSYAKHSNIYHAVGTDHKNVCLLVHPYSWFGWWPVWWSLIRLCFLPNEMKCHLSAWLIRLGLHTYDPHKAWQR